MRLLKNLVTDLFMNTKMLWILKVWKKLQNIMYSMILLKKKNPLYVRICGHVNEYVVFAKAELCEKDTHTIMSSFMIRGWR